MLGGVGTAKRIQELRTRAGKSDVEMARILGMNIHWYYDLEFHDDELVSTLSLAQALRLAAQLAVSLHDLLEVTSQPADTVLLPELPLRIETFVRSEGISMDEFEDRIGWELASFLAMPVEVALERPVMFLQDLASGLGILWAGSHTDGGSCDLTRGSS